MIDRIRRLIGRAALALGTWLIDVGVSLDPVVVPDGFTERLMGRLGLSVMGDTRNGHHRGGRGDDHVI